jgi:hypothetical protein
MTGSSHIRLITAPWHGAVLREPGVDHLDTCLVEVGQMAGGQGRPRARQIAAICASNPSSAAKAARDNRAARHENALMAAAGTRPGAGPECPADPDGY